MNPRLIFVIILDRLNIDSGSNAVHWQSAVNFVGLVTKGGQGTQGSYNYKVDKDTSARRTSDSCKSLFFRTPIVKVLLR